MVFKKSLVSKGPGFDRPTDRSAEPWSLEHKQGAPRSPQGLRSPKTCWPECPPQGPWSEWRRLTRESLKSPPPGRRRSLRFLQPSHRYRGIRSREPRRPISLQNRGQLNLSRARVAPPPPTLLRQPPQNLKESKELKECQEQPTQPKPLYLKFLPKPLDLKQDLYAPRTAS